MNNKINTLMNTKDEFEFDFSLCHGCNYFNDDDDSKLINYPKCLYSG